MAIFTPEDKQIMWTDKTKTSRPTIYMLEVNTRPTTQLVLVVAKSYVDEQTDEFESKKHGTDRLFFCCFDSSP